MGSVFAIKDFRLDRVIFVRDTIFYVAAVSLLFYIFTGPGRIRLRDSVALLGLYFLYVCVVLASKYFIKDRPLKNLHGPSKADQEEGGIEFEGVYIDDDPTASMVVMRRFLFYNDDALAPAHRPPTFKVDKITNGDTLTSSINDNSLTIATQKSSRRVTLFEGKPNWKPNGAQAATATMHNTMHQPAQDTTTGQLANQIVPIPYPNPNPKQRTCSLAPTI